MTNVKVEHDVNQDYLITIKGNTKAPNGSIIYAQHQIYYKMSDTKHMEETMMKVLLKNIKGKHHHISFTALASNLFDLESMKVGQKTYLKIFCAKQKISTYDEIYGYENKIENSAKKDELNQRIENYNKSSAWHRFFHKV